MFDKSNSRYFQKLENIVEKRRAAQSQVPDDTFANISMVSNRAAALIGQLQNKYNEDTGHVDGLRSYKRSLEDYHDYKHARNKAEMRSNIQKLRKRIYKDDRANRLLDK